MKFSTSRALELVQALAFPRRAGTDGERRAADLVAEDFTRSGWQVERRAVEGSSFLALVAPWLDWLGVGVWATAGVILNVRGAAGPFRLPPIILSLFWLRLTAVYRYRASWPPLVTTQNVTARRQVPSDPPVRVVFVAPLGTLAPAWLIKVGRSNLLIVWLLLLLLLMSILPPLFGLPIALPVFVVGLLWIVLLRRAWWSLKPPPDDASSDNRTGLAVLLELARTWPKGTSERIETRFAAVGGQALNFAGARALVRSLDAETPPKPTLILVFAAPGMGAKLILGASRQRPLAESAASDLWIPHRALRRPENRAAFWPFEYQQPDLVCLIGEEVLDPPEDPQVIPEALNRAAQLATEIALRWAKQTAP